jgi:glutamate formiminotransferase
MPLVECVPNFSEGRRQAVIDELVVVVQQTAGVRVLDVHSDVDHNRTVITFAGEPESVCNAAFAVVARAARLIDMDHQQGQHPRIGATDVLPLVPLDGMTLAECAALARQLGERIGTELNIPIYLYEAAATHPDRVNLADVLRGEYEGLKAAISSDPDRAPDFGPTVLGSAGATAVGARLPLIAYNVYLTTDDVEIARSIAQKIRYSSGGLPHVKALGLLVKGRAQVSMNLTDYTQTPVHQVMEQIRQEAVRHGVSVHSSELVGLIPQAALIEAARWYLQLDEFDSNQILEERLKKQILGS